MGGKFRKGPSHVWFTVDTHRKCQCIRDGDLPYCRANIAGNDNHFLPLFKELPGNGNFDNDCCLRCGMGLWNHGAFWLRNNATLFFDCAVDYCYRRSKLYLPNQ